MDAPSPCPNGEPMLARIPTAGLAAVLLFPVLLRADDAPKWDKEIQGEWELQRKAAGGLVGAIEDTYKTVAYFYEDEAAISNVPTVPGVIVILDDETLVGTFRLKIDATKKPRFIDATVAAGRDKGQVRWASTRSRATNFGSARPRPARTGPRNLPHR